MADATVYQAQANELSQKLWAIANNLRGNMDASKFKNYILGLIFYRYLSERTVSYMSDLLKNDGITYEKAFTDEDFRPTVEEWSLNHLGYIIQPKHLFSELVRKINEPVDDEDKFSVAHLQKAVNELTASTMGHGSNKAFNGLFADMRLDDSELGDTVSARTKLIGQVMSQIANIDFNLEDAQFDVLGTAYMILIGLFQSQAGKKGGEFFTPAGPSQLCAKLAAHGLESAKTVGDCTCGSASMLLEVQKHLTTGRVGHFYGQELNGTTYNLARMNMIMHGVNWQDFDIYKADTLSQDKYYIEDEETGSKEIIPMTIQVCNPPYSLKWDAPSSLLEDPRYSGAGKLAPKGHADFAFLEHMVHHMDEEDGRVAVLLPHGVLFRGNAEESIRKYLIETLNRLDAVIGLPANLFHGTGIPVCILVLKSKRDGNSDNILFIDASKEFKPGKNQNILEDEHIQKIVDAYVARVDVPKFAHVATMDEIRENGYNLNIPRYVDTSEEEEQVDIAAVRADIAARKAEGARLEAVVEGYLKELLRQVFAREIRFKDENGQDYPEWENRVMEKMFDNIVDKNHPDATVLTIIQGEGTFPRDSVGRRIQYDDSGLPTYKMVHTNDFIMHLRSFEGGLEMATCDGIVSPAYTILRSTIPIVPALYKLYFRSFPFIDGKLKRITEGIRDGRSINMNDFWKLEIPYPSLPEQQRIADFFTALDAQIENERALLEDWRQLKKGLLQQMFV